MTVQPVYVYCGSKGPFTDEHVLARAYAGPGENWMLKDSPLVLLAHRPRRCGVWIPNRNVRLESGEAHNVDGRGLCNR